MKNPETIIEYGAGIVYLSDLNDKIASGEINDVIMLAEAIQERSIAHIAHRIAAEEKRIILVAGPSSSGKTSFSKRLCLHLWTNGVRPIYLGTDDYYAERDEVKPGLDGFKNFENIDTLDLDLFNEQLRDLLDGKIVDIPRFDFNLGKKVYGERLTQAHEGQSIVVEGIHGLNPVLTPAISDKEKFKIFIAPLTEPKINDSEKIQASDIRKIRRIVRDNYHRGWDVRKTLNTWEIVRNGEYENILPYKDNADDCFNSSLIYELPVLKPIVVPLLEEISEYEENYDEAQRIINILSNVDEITDTKYIATNSILREFIGDSIVVD